MLFQPSAPIYTPEDWYWFIGSDTANVYSSKRALLVPVNDPEYVDWSQAAFTPTLDSMATLEAMMAQQYPPGTLKSHNPYARALKATGGIVVTSISPRMFGTAVVDRNAIANSLEYAKATPGNTCDWKLPDSTFIALDEAQLTTVSNAIAAFVSSAFSIEKANSNAIIGGTITTIAEIDDAFAALSNVFP
jgi:hypothetical protein